jgi:hypothetical protein
MLLLPHEGLPWHPPPAAYPAVQTSAPPSPFPPPPVSVSAVRLGAHDLDCGTVRLSIYAWDVFG